MPTLRPPPFPASEFYVAMEKAESELGKLQVVASCAAQIAGYDDTDAVDRLSDLAINSWGLKPDATQQALATGRQRAEEAIQWRKNNPIRITPLRPPHPEGNGIAQRKNVPLGERSTVEQPKWTGDPVLSLKKWLSRDLPEPDFLMGNWLTTTSRVVLNAATGLGKSMFGIGLGMAIAAGREFLHWQPVRPATVLYIDGEMSRRLLKQRLADEAIRLGVQPERFHALSHEDVEAFAPLNSKEGQEFIEAEIKRIGNVDLIIPDNIMSLIVGDMKDEESWRQTLPWIRQLTSRRIGQLWIHHTGHDTTRGYGTSTREWQMDTVMQLDKVDRNDTDVSFKLKFAKARERTPATRRDFADTKIALVNDAWNWEPTEGASPAKISPAAGKFLEALRNATIDSNIAKMSGCPTATHDQWQAELRKLSLLEADMKSNTARALFSKYKRELVVANRIAANETLAWTLS